MVDVVSKSKRSEMMSGIKGKDTKPELLIRSALHRKGYRFRKNVTSLPGRPDIVLPKYRSVIQMQGCFWHGHDCHLFKMPSTRTEFWSTKIDTNKRNDEKSLDLLIKDSWKVLFIWECAIKGKARLNFELIIKAIDQFLLASDQFIEIKGVE